MEAVSMTGPPKRRSRTVIVPGSRFGRLIVLEKSAESPDRYTHWVCRCDCGNRTTVRSSRLTAGNTKSCGCFQREGAQRLASVIAKKHLTKHGMAESSEYHIWCTMKARCGNPKHPQYDDYGGRGIKVHPAWIASFEAFYEHLGPRPSTRHSVDRINNDGSYEPGNVRWATYSEQARNRRPARRKS